MLCACCTLLCPYFILRLPCCAIILFYTYPAVPLFIYIFLAHLGLLAFIFLRIYPAVPLFFFALTLLRPYFILHLTYFHRNFRMYSETKIEVLCATSSSKLCVCRCLKII